MTDINKTIEAMKLALSKSDEALAKSITQATGLVAYDLQAPAKNLYPVMTPIRNRMPRVGGGTGMATNWKQVSAIIGSGKSAMPWVPEGQRTARMSYVTADKAATYRTIGEEDQVSYEAFHAAAGFEDVRASMVMRLLQQMMIKEEHALVGGNNSLALGTVGTVTVGSSASGGSIGAATYNVICVALTYEGMQMASISGGLPVSALVTGADGLTYTLNGGTSAKSAAASTGALSGSTNQINASVVAIVGAAGYAWFVGTAGNEVLTTITTINSMVLLTLAGAGTQNASAITADWSRNSSYAFDGLLTTALSGLGSYVRTLATGTAGVGTVLTAGGRGNVTEIDVMLKAMWDNYRVSPSVIYVNSQELKNITDKVVSNASAPLLRYQSDGSEPYGIVAGGVIAAYFNPFSLDGGSKIPIKLHPFLPAGTILAHTENLPMQYQSHNVPNVAEVKVRTDYYQIDWPLRTRQQEVGVYAEEVLAVYAPFAEGVINNIANG
jgi:hypothetical protein